MADGMRDNLCPHCQQPIEVSAADGGSLRRCLQCGFFYPRPSYRLDAPHYRDRNLLPGDRYRLIAPLRAIGFVRVYLAQHLVLDEPCVVKILSMVDPNYSEKACKRFVDEAKAGFRIRHANVARVLDCDRNGDHWYFVMEYVDGLNLGDVLRDCVRLPWPQVVEVGVQTARGLAAIHDAGLLHRDIKPSNLILSPDGGVKIADLGLVEILNGSATHSTGTGLSFQGTPQYMSPEQRAGGGQLDQRTDLYSLGATMFHMLFGMPPCRGRGPLDYLTVGDTYAPLEWPTDVTPPVPKWLRHVIEKCLAPNPNERFDTCLTVVKELQDWTEPADAAAGAVGIHGIGTPKGIVVLPFSNLSSNQDDQWLANALAEEIHNTLLTFENVQVIDRHELLSLLGRMYAEAGAEYTNAQLIDAARRVGAATVVRGSFQNTGNRLMVTVSRLVADRPAGKMLARITGSVDEIIELQVRVGKEVAAALGLEIGDRRPPKTAVNRFVTQCYTNGQAAFAAGKYAKALEHAKAGLEDDPESVELLSLLGVCHSRLGQYDQAISCHMQLEEIARRDKDPYRQVEAAGNLGVAYYFKGDFARAYEPLQRAAQMASDLNLLPLLAKECNNIGFVLTRLERLTEADHAFEEAIRIKLSLGSTASLVMSFNGRGDIAFQQGRVDDALRFYNQALVWARELGDHDNEGICRTKLGRCYVHLRDFEQAESHLSASLDALAATEFWYGKSYAYEQVAEMHLTRRLPETAIPFIDKRIELARKHGNINVEAAAWEQKAKAHEMMGQSDKAMECLKKSLQLQQQAPLDMLKPRDTKPR